MKENEVHPLDEFFRKGLSEGEFTPPSAGWAQMESLLDAGKVQEQPRRRIGFWLLSVAASVLVLMVAGIAYWNTGKDGFNPFLVQVLKPEIGKNYKTDTNLRSAAKNGETSLLASQEVRSLPSIPSGNSNPELRSKPVSKPNAIPPVPTESTGQSVEVNVLEILPSSPPNGTESATNENLKNKESGSDPMEIPEESAEIARVEFRSGNRTPESEELASIEWKKTARPRLNLGESIARFKSGDLGKVPGISDAKENLIAWLGFRK